MHFQTVETCGPADELYRLSSSECQSTSATFCTAFVCRRGEPSIFAHTMKRGCSLPCSDIWHIQLFIPFYNQTVNLALPPCWLAHSLARRSLADDWQLARVLVYVLHCVICCILFVYVCLNKKKCAQYKPLSTIQLKSTLSSSAEASIV